MDTTVVADMTRTFSIESLPPELLGRVLALTESPSALLAVAAAGSRTLRATLLSPNHRSLWRVWGALVLRAADPAACLALFDRDSRLARTPQPEDTLTQDEVEAERVSHLYEADKEIHLMHGAFRVAHYPYHPGKYYRGPGVAPAEYMRALKRAADDAAEASSSPQKPETQLSTHNDDLPEWAVTLAGHAQRLGSWPALVRALTQRNCAACGGVTHWVAWSANGSGSDAEVHAESGDVAALEGAAAVQGASPVADVVDPSTTAATCGPSRCCPTCVLPGLSGGADAPLQRCVVLNAAFFDAVDPVAEVEGVIGDPESREAYSKYDAVAAALQHALDECPDGGTILLKGIFKLRVSLNTNGRAVRLMGKPPPNFVAFAGVGGLETNTSTDPQVVAPLVLAAHEAEAEHELGRPSATLKFEMRLPMGLRVIAPLWLDGLNVRTGNEYETGKVGWPHLVSDEMMQCGPICDGVSLRDAGAGVPPLAARPFVAQRCWLTAYSGSGVVLDRGAHASLLRCCIINCVGAAVACNTGATLRMRGCHVVFNNADITAGAEARLRDAPALQRINHFEENWPTPGTIDVFAFPAERMHMQYPHMNTLPPAFAEVAPWSPMFTERAILNSFQPGVYPEGWSPPSVVFPRVHDVALLAD